MSKYRKKPVIIEAEQFNGSNLNSDESLFKSPDVIVHSNSPDFLVNTLEGIMTGTMGDWLIRGVKGELYPCKPDIFAATYDSVQEALLPEPIREPSIPKAPDNEVKCPKCDKVLIPNDPRNCNC